MSRRPNRIPRSSEDLLRELSSSALLRISCDVCDAGEAVAGKPIAVTLWLLLRIEPV